MLFGYFDISWAYLLLDTSINATGDEYEMSYGQVWSPLFGFGSQMLTKHMPV